jgi:hypothetical protein
MSSPLAELTQYFELYKPFSPNPVKPPWTRSISVYKPLSALPDLIPTGSPQLCQQKNKNLRGIRRLLVTADSWMTGGILYIPFFDHFPAELRMYCQEDVICPHLFYI